MQNKLQITLNKFIQEAKKLKLPINTEKTKFMMFGKRSQIISIKIENTNIQRFTNFKYLGTWMDENLKFKKQIEELKSKARKGLNIIRFIYNKNNKLSPKKTITVHRSIIRGILEQGASYTENASKTFKKSLQTIANQSSRKITGCTKTTPIYSLMAIAAEVPLHIRSKYIATKETLKTITYSKIHQNQITTNINSIAEKKNKIYVEKIITENRELLEKMAKIKINNIEVTILIHLKPDEEIPKDTPHREIILRQQFEQQIRKLEKMKPIIYTDGIKIEDKCGIGIYIKPHNKPNQYIASHFKLKNTVPITSVEITAIEKALQIANENNLKN